MESCGQAQLRAADASYPRSSIQQLEKPSRSLLDLPPELWTKICKLAATPDHDLIIPRNATRIEFQNLLRQPSIIRTCHLVRTETLQHFYCNAVIMIEQQVACEDLSALQSWLDAIGERNRADIQPLPFGSLQQCFKDGLEVLVIPVRVQKPLGGLCPVEEHGDDDEDLVASVRRYVMGPEPISI